MGLVMFYAYNFILTTVRVGAATRGLQQEERGGDELCKGTHRFLSPFITHMNTRVWPPHKWGMFVCAQVTTCYKCSCVVKE